MIKKLTPKNKKGVMGIIFFFLVLFTILIFGFIAVIVVGLLNYTSDIVTPIMEDIENIFPSSSLLLS